MRKRVDDNQREIVIGLRKAGYSVFVLSNVGHGLPDILCGAHRRNFLFEIKDGKKPLSAQKLTSCEAMFHLSWAGQVNIITSLDDAFNIIGKYIRKV